MSDIDRGPPPPPPQPKAGWDDMGTLEMRPKAVAERPAAFSLGVWVLLWVLLCTVGAGAAELAQHSTSSAEMSGRIFGSGLAVWLIAYAFGWLAYRLTGRNLIVGRVVVCIFAGLMLLGKLAQGTLIDATQRKQDRIEVADSLRKDLNTLTGSAQGDGPIPTLDTTATVGGELGELQLFVKTYLNNVIALQNDYMAELKAIGWDEVLNPERLKKDKDLVETKLVVGRAKATVEKYRQRWNALSADTRTRVENMAADSAEKRGFVKGFRSSSMQGDAQAMKIWALEASIVSTMDEIVAVLESTNGSWAVEDGAFVFPDQQSLDAFNRHVERVNELTRQEEAIRAASAASAEASLRQAAQ